MRGKIQKKRDEREEIKSIPPVLWLKRILTYKGICKVKTQTMESNETSFL